jgi:endonuclease/exonuclease/phosphatase family metal-dependent hydrolase
MPKPIWSVAALALVSPLLAITSGIASEGAVAAETTTVRIATFNVQVRRPVSDFSAGVLPLLDRADIIGLQEVDTYDKEEVLRSAADAGWSYYRARPGLQEPVLWRTDRFTFAGGRIATVSAAGYIGNEVPNMKAYQHARTVTVVRLIDNVTGRRLSVIDAHLVSGAIRGGRPWVGRPKLFRLYREGLVNLMHQVITERAWGRVYALGDFNAGWVADRKYLRKKLPIRTMAGLSMTSMWAWSRPTNGLGTHNDALIDQIFTTNRPTSARVQFDLSGHSDHRPAIASYAAP